MKTRIHTLAVLLFVVALTSCSFGPSVTRLKDGSYHVTTGHALIAKQEIQYVSIETREGDKILVQGKKQKSTDAAMIYGMVQMSEISAGVENLKTKEGAGVEKAAINADVQKTQMGAGVVKHANSANSALEIPAQIPSTLPR